MADYTKIAPVQVAINGIMVRALILVLHLMYGMEVVVFAIAPINIVVTEQMRPEAEALHVEENIAAALVLQDMLGVLLVVTGDAHWTASNVKTELVKITVLKVK